MGVSVNYRPVVVAVTPAIRKLFRNAEIRGEGGFQTLCRDIATRVKTGGPILRLAPNEFKRICQYATAYGEGGFQQKLRLIVASWASQHVDELVETSVLRGERRHTYISPVAATTAHERRRA